MGSLIGAFWFFFGDTPVFFQRRILGTSIAVAYACLKVYDEPVREWLKDHWLNKSKKESMYETVYLPVSWLFIVGCVVFQPLASDFVGKMGHFEIRERRFETFAVGTGGEHTDSDGMVCLYPCIAHHVVFLIVE